MSKAGRYIIVIAAFLAWMFSGMHMSITHLAMRPAAIDLMDRAGALDLDRFNAFNAQLARGEGPLPIEDASRLSEWNAQAIQWFAWYQCALLFGAAAGGYVFGRLGDRVGRSKALAASVFCLSVFSAVSYFAQGPWQLLIIRFITCMGIGGCWPNGVALVSEAWSNLSRPMLAGVIGIAANVGIYLMASIGARIQITPEEWRWVMLVGASPLVLGVLIMFVVPESPLWLSKGARHQNGPSSPTPTQEVFGRPYLKVTLLGIALATIPLAGGWGSANWMIPWADEAGATADPPDPFLKAKVSQARAFTGMVGSLLGGWIASVVGRRSCYFVTSLAGLATAQYAFWFTTPTDASFLFWVGVLGFFNGIYFGWLPLFLPELFPTRIRSTGAGVSFNFGRILTAITIFATGALKDVFGGDYAQIGRVTSLVFALGMIVIFFAPKTDKKELED